MLASIMVVREQFQLRLLSVGSLAMLIDWFHIDSFFFLLFIDDVFTMCSIDLAKQVTNSSVLFTQFLGASGFTKSCR